MRDRARALKLKERGNRFFAARKYRHAAELFGKAILHDDSEATLWANRAACHHALGDYAAAVRDALVAVDGGKDSLSMAADTASEDGVVKAPGMLTLTACVRPARRPGAPGYAHFGPGGSM